MAVLVSLLDRFQAREWRYFRASMFSALGAYGIAPVVHQWWLNSDVPQVKTALVYDLIMGATYLVRGWPGLRLPYAPYAKVAALAQLLSIKYWVYALQLCTCHA